MEGDEGECLRLYAACWGHCDWLVEFFIGYKSEDVATILPS